MQDSTFKLDDGKFSISIDQLTEKLTSEISKNTRWYKVLHGKELSLFSIFDNYLYSFEPEDRYILVSDCKIKSDNGLSPLVLENVNFSAYTGIIFNNCTIHSAKFNSCRFKTLIFHNCIVKEEILFETNNSIESLRIEDGSSMGMIDIKNGTSCDHMEITEKSIVNHITVSSSSLCKYITLSKESKCHTLFVKQANAGTIHVDRGSILQNLDLAYKSSINSIEVTKESTIRIIVNRWSTSVNSIQIDEQSVVDQMHIFENSLLENLSCFTHSKLLFLEVEIGSLLTHLNISDASLARIKMEQNRGSISLKNADIGLCELLRCKIHLFEWNIGTKGEVYMNDCEVNWLKLNNAVISKDSTICIYHTKILVIQMQELVVLGQLFFRHISGQSTAWSWDEDVLKKYFNRKNITGHEVFHDHWIETISSIRSDYEGEVAAMQQEIEKTQLPLLKLVDSSLGKSEITGCDFSNFLLEFRDSKIMDMFISGSRLPKERIVIAKTDLKNTFEFEQKSSYYDQLKRINENQGNMVEATWYHAKAMESHEQLAIKEYIKVKWSRFSRKISMLLEVKARRLNYISNNHGDSWRRALFFIVVGSIVLYVFYYLSIHFNDKFSLS